MAEERPDCPAVSRSCALALRISSLLWSSASAMARRHSFFSGAVSLANSRDAALACLASCIICSASVMA